MNKDEALEWIVKTKAISPLTRNFIVWLYDNGWRITKEPESQKLRLLKRMAECKDDMCFDTTCEACHGTGYISFA